MKHHDDLKLKKAGQETVSPTDAEIAAAGLEAVEWLTTISSESIKLNVKHGWVNLEGTVDWSHQRDTVGEVIRRVAGVKGVTNLITLNSDMAAQQAA